MKLRTTHILSYVLLALSLVEGPAALSQIAQSPTNPQSSQEPKVEKITDAPSVDLDYRLVARDLVQFEVFEEPETHAIQRVSSTGSISVPMLGLIVVANRTLREVQQSTQGAYIDRGFFVHPQVLITVQSYSPRCISVLGQVNHPEQISLPIETDRIGMMQAITLAQGFTRLAKIDDVRVVRVIAGHEEQYIVNIDNYLASRGREPDFSLLPDDVVFVPERTF